MFTASVLFFIIRTLFQQSSWMRRHLTPTLKFLLWNVYVGALGLIAISRMYFACHFFHQCVLGIFFGIAISHFLQHRKVNQCLTEMRRKNGLLLGILLVIICVSVYYSHYFVSSNPQWAVKKVYQIITHFEYTYFSLFLESIAFELFHILKDCEHRCHHHRPFLDFICSFTSAYFFTSVVETKQILSMHGMIVFHQNIVVLG